MNKRFTLDGDAGLESHLAQTCAGVANGVRTLVPPERLEAVVLGGGYGRGEGGVLHTRKGDQPYNDLEFYVFLRGSRLANERRYREQLRQLGEDLSAGAGLHVEFKTDSLERLRRSPVSMFTYDLVSGHRIVHGSPGCFAGCAHHFKAGDIPLSEATRLLFNRCTGLLLVKDLLRRPLLKPEESDFIGRNLAKAQLALGDALLAALGLYHWSCRERHVHLTTLDETDFPGALDTVRKHHAAGVEFKLHPRRTLGSAAEFAKQHTELASLCLRLWLWVESRRLGCSFESPWDYAFSPVRKCPETPGWRNYCLNLRTFGARAAWDTMSTRYPRERLFNALALLLWSADGSQPTETRQKLRSCLQTDAADWSGLVEAYKEVWPVYG